MFQFEDHNSLNNNFDLQQDAKNLVMEEMEKSGMISRMRANIKQSVLKILENQKQSVKNNIEFDYMTPLHRMNKSKDILLAYHIIKDFMQFFELEYTMPIFENETNIKENIKRETLLNELSLNNQNNNFSSSMQVEHNKPVLILLINQYLQELNNKKHIETTSHRLDESYGVIKSHTLNLDVNFNNDKKPESNTQSFGKKQLVPLTFSNKSVDLKDSSLNSNINFKENDSLKFNTANIDDVYSQNNISNNIALNTHENKNTIKENRKIENHSGEELNFNFNSAEYTSNNKYDDEFNEVILEEINEGKIQLNKNKEDEIEDSKKSLTASNIVSSMGYDSSVTNYNLEDFDHIEEVEKPN